VLFLLRKVYLVLVAIYSAVIPSPDFDQVHFVKKENDRGMDVRDLPKEAGIGQQCESREQQDQARVQP
jgi:hypothetical protein